MANRYPLKCVFKDVAYQLRAQARRGNHDQSVTTIRTMINNLLDSWDKAGFKVNHDYNQDRAIKRVRQLVTNL